MEWKEQERKWIESLWVWSFVDLYYVPKIVFYDQFCITRTQLPFVAPEIRVVITFIRCSSIEPSKPTKGKSLKLRKRFHWIHSANISINIHLVFCWKMEKKQKAKESPENITANVFFWYLKYDGFYFYIYLFAS